jgi:hypothetical protein
MKRYGYRAAAVVSLLCAVGAGVPTASAHGSKDKKVDAKLYEVTENMSLDSLSKPTLRSATASLQGTAKLGSALCPTDLVRLLAGLDLVTRGNKPCTVTAIGSDKVDTTTGSGTVDGTFAVVVNLDNTTDAAEFVVMTGTFNGSMQVVIDTSVNPPRQLPLINLNDGTFTPHDVLGVPIPAVGMICLEPTKKVKKFCLDPKDFAPASFTGVFRLPFMVDRFGWRQRAQLNREAFYLGDDGQLIKVQPDERSLGVPTVRVEIDF